MGINLTSRVITKYEADISHEAKAIKKLASMKERAAVDEIVKIKQVEEAQEAAFAKQLQRQEAISAKQIVGIGKMGLAAAGIGFGWSAASDAMDHYARSSQLKFASQDADIGKLKSAFGGLRTEFETMEFAAAGLHGIQKLTQNELELTARYMRLLVSEGNDMKTVFNAVQRAVVEGNAEGLRPFGENIKGAAGETATLTKVLERMKERVDRAGSSIKIAGEDGISAKTKLRELWDDIKANAGSAFNSLASGANDAVTGFKKLNQYVADGRDWLMSWEKNIQRATFALPKMTKEMARLSAEYEKLAKKRREADPDGTLTRPADSTVVKKDRGLVVGSWAWQERFKKEEAEKVKAQYAKDIANQVAQAEKAKAAWLALQEKRRLAELQGPSFDLRNTKQQVADKRLLDIVEGSGALGGPTGAGVLGRGKFEDLSPWLRATRATDNQASIVGGIPIVPGGTPTSQSLPRDFWAGSQSFLDPTIKALGTGEKAMKSFEGAFNSAVKGIIFGGKSISSALKEAFGNAIMAKSLDLFATATHEGVMALVSIARWDGAGAAMHGKAAVTAAAGGAALAAMALQLGVGARAPAGVAGSGGNFGAGIAAGGGDRRNTVVMLGNDFTGRSRREQSSDLAHILSLANREQGSSVVRDG